jgi:dihydropteroate synthase
VWRDARPVVDVRHGGRAGNTVTLVMGVLNVTPDSFSDGGLWFDTDAAIAHGIELAAQGADIVDVGGESTRPGASRVPIEIEIERVVPVIGELAARGIRISIDTMNSRTAWAAAEAGASIINDVSGGLADPAMADAAVSSGLDYVVMHWRGHSADMNSLAQYSDVARESRDELFARVDALIAAGADPAKLIVDPGLGFSKNADHNWQVLAHLAVYEERGLPVLIGASRKRFLGALLPEDAPVEARDVPTAVISALAAQAGVWGVRVHDVPSTRVALDVLAHWHAAAGSDASDA